MTDELLVGEALNGSQEAYAALYGKIKPWARNLGFRILRSQPWEQEDFAHDATAKVLMSLGGFEGNAKFTTWATRVMTNLALEKLRKGGRAKREMDLVYLDAPVGDGAPRAEVAVDASSVEDRTIAEEQVSRIMRRISSKDGSVLWEVEAMGFTNAEVSQMRGISIAATKSLLYRARKRARLAMAA